MLRIVFSDRPIAESDEVKPGVMLDYDLDGTLVGVEILDASKQVSHPARLEYSVVGVNSP